MALHGCGGQVDGLSGWDFIVRYGYTQYAASNDLIIIFPQIRANMENTGCWDFWGYLNKDYLNNESIQGQAIVNMIKGVKVGYRESRRYDYTAYNLNNDLYFEWYDFWRILFMLPDQLGFGIVYVIYTLLNSNI